MPLRYHRVNNRDESIEPVCQHPIVHSCQASRKHPPHRLPLLPCTAHALHKLVPRRLQMLPEHAFHSTLAELKPARSLRFRRAKRLLDCLLLLHLLLTNGLLRTLLRQLRPLLLSMSVAIFTNLTRALMGGMHTQRQTRT